MTKVGSAEQLWGQGLMGSILTFISFTADFLEAGENLSTYITCIALMIVPTNGMASWESDETMVGNNS